MTSMCWLTFISFLEVDRFCGLFGDRQKYRRKLKCRAQRYTQYKIRTLPRGKSSDERRRKTNERCLRKEINDTASFIKCATNRRYEVSVGRPRFSIEVGNSDPQLEEIVQDEVERVLAPVSTKPTETRPRPTYAAVGAPVQKFPPEPRKTDLTKPVCFHCGRWTCNALRLSLLSKPPTELRRPIRRPNSSRESHERPIPNTSLGPRRHIADQSVARP
ncbi:hypothetical protein TNCV_4366881 [Trichonephila clavipes]|nr:hypothetical protein TNCV_4366881 [Trichonephila clavipes]